VGRVGANQYLLDKVRDRMSFTNTVKAMRTSTQRWPKARLKLVEDKANGSAIIDTLRGEIGGIVAVNPQGSKEARAHAAAPDLEAGNFYLPKDAPWVSDFIEEAAQFPNGSHDDQVDAWSQVAARFRASAHSGISSTTETKPFSGPRRSPQKATTL
jgi:predicted phage terminase large subunit-like protein